MIAFNSENTKPSRVNQTQATKLKYEIVAVNNIDVMVDVSLLAKSDQLYFNATDVARQFGKKPIEWLDSKQGTEYIAVILEVENFRYENLLRKSGLTDCQRLDHNLFAVTHLTVGRGNLFSIGVNTPRTFAVFLCLPFCTVFRRISIMAGCFGQLSGWLATNTQYFHPTTTRRPSRGKLDRWITSLSIGVTA